MCSLLATKNKKIIYCSRTHDQLSNVHHDFKLTKYKEKNSISFLASRSIMHQNECNCLKPSESQKILFDTIFEEIKFLALSKEEII